MLRTRHVDKNSEGRPTVSTAQCWPTVRPTAVRRRGRNQDGRAALFAPQFPLHFLPLAQAALLFRQPRYRLAVSALNRVIHSIQSFTVAAVVSAVRRPAAASTFHDLHLFVSLCLLGLRAGRGGGFYSGVELFSYSVRTGHIVTGRRQG